MTKLQFRWDWDFIFKDLDGSLTGAANSVAVSANNITLNNPNCQLDMSYDTGMNCVDKKGWIRFAFMNVNPLLVKLTNISDANNQWVSVPFRGKRLTHIPGFMVALEANQTYTMVFDQALYPTNISYDGAFYNVLPGQYLIIQHIMHKKPDRVSYGNALLNAVESLIPIRPSSSQGSWHWENSTNTLRYLLLRYYSFFFLFRQFFSLI